MGIYTPEQLHASLVRAFKHKNADYVVLDDENESSEFVRTAIRWAENNGLLYEDYQTSSQVSGAEYTARVYRLSKRGRLSVFESTEREPLFHKLIRS